MDNTFKTNEITTIQKMLSAGTGAILTSLMVTPFDVVKTRMQSIDTLAENGYLSRFHPSHLHTQENPSSQTIQANNPGKSRIQGTWHGIRIIASSEGPAALWRGLIPTLIMAIPSTVIYYTSYEYMRDSIHPVFHSLNMAFYAPLCAGSAARGNTSILILFKIL